MKLKRKELRLREPLPAASEVVGAEVNESRRFFSVERDFSQADWDIAFQSMQDARAKEDWTLFAARASQLCSINPERRDELGITEDDIQQIQDLMSIGLDDMTSLLAEYLVTIFPERRDEFRHGYNMKSKCKDEVFLARRDWEAFFQRALRYLVLYPENRDELRLSDVDLKEMIANAESYRRAGKWLLFANKAHMIMLIFPDSKEMLRIDRTTQEEVMKRYDHWHGQVSVVFWAPVLKVLAADRAEITSDGIQLYHDDEIGQTPSLPLRKEVA